MPNNLAGNSRPVVEFGKETCDRGNYGSTNIGVATHRTSNCLSEYGSPGSLTLEASKPKQPSLCASHILFRYVATFQVQRQAYPHN